MHCYPPARSNAHHWIKSGSMSSRWTLSPSVTVHQILSLESRNSIASDRVNCADRSCHRPEHWDFCSHPTQLAVIAGRACHRPVRLCHRAGASSWAWRSDENRNNNRSAPRCPSMFRAVNHRFGFKLKKFSVRIYVPSCPTLA